MSRKFKILIVDDNPKNIQVLALILQQEGYDLAFATSGEKALKIASEVHIDLILLDVMMPGKDGFETCKELKNSLKTSKIPVIFLTALSDKENIIKGFSIGGIDYVTKPFNTKELLIRVKTHLQLKDYENNLEYKVHELTKEIEATQREIIFIMGAIIESRSKETSNHVKRVAEYSKLLALLYSLPFEEAELLREASPMHDIGKVGIPDAILNKSEKLTSREWEIIKTHAELGYDILKYSQRSILKVASIVAFEHHEKWDGSGYPRGLSGENIHIYGRITALADVFDALGSKRIYKDAWPMDKILKYIRNQSGKHFEPKLVKLFNENLDEFLRIRSRLKDM